MRCLIRLLDLLIRRASGVYEFSNHPECILRLQNGISGHSIHLEEKILPKGVPVLLIHLWNEHLPITPEEGVDLLWAHKFFHLFEASLRQAAVFTASVNLRNPFQAVGGTTSLLMHKGHPASQDLLKRLGFTLNIWESRLGRFGEFWENVYAWALLWAYNPNSLRYHHLADLHRVEFWMSWAKFQMKYGKQSLSILKSGN